MKRKTKRLNQTEIQEALLAYSSGATIKEIAQKFNVNRNSLSKCFQDQGIQTKKQAKSPSVGDGFYYLTLIEPTFYKISTKKSGKPQKVLWGKFLCKCGKEHFTRIRGVLDNTIKSCGCYNREAARQRLTGQTISRTHGLAHVRARIYLTWVRMKTRAKQLGKSVDPLFRLFVHFKTWAETNGYDDNQILSLIDKNSHYNKENIKFISKKEYKEIQKQKLRKRTLGKKIPETTREKIRQTCLKKYGVDSPLKNKEIQEKIKQTWIEKYGTPNPGALESAKAKARATCLKKYGETHFSKTKEGRLLGKRNTIKNGQATVYDGKTTDELATELGIARSTMNARIRKYGIEVAISTEKFETVIEKAIESILNKNNIVYQKQVKIDKYWADFLLPEHSIVIEADGLYWHSDAVNDDNTYHKKKMDAYQQNGYQSLFFRENEIEKKIDVIESIILNKVGKSNRIYARQCQIIECQDAKFFENNHLMGKGVGKCIFLIYNNEKVAGVRVVNKSDYIDINRFCTKLNTSIIGGFSKLIKYIQKQYNKKIKTFVDRRYGDGQYLEKLGFKKTNEDLSFMWTKDEKAFHRMKFKKNSGYDHKYFKIWDCGQARYETL